MTNDTWHQQVYKRQAKLSGIKYSEWRLLRDEVLRRDRFTCLRCLKRFRSKKYLMIRHLVSVANGGTNAAENLITLCNHCDNYATFHNLQTIHDITGSVNLEGKGLVCVGQ